MNNYFKVHAKKDLFEFNFNMRYLQTENWKRVFFENQIFLHINLMSECYKLHLIRIFMGSESAQPIKELMFKKRSCVWER